MTEPLTRETVEREVREAIAPVELDVGERVAAALLAGAECDVCRGSGRHQGTEHNLDCATVPQKCWRCRGTGLNQSSLARALAALRGAGT